MAKKIFILLMPILILSGCAVKNPLNTKNEINCEQEYKKIDNEIELANYCQKDSDCQELLLGGKYIEFGCYHYVNKDVDKKSLIEKVKKYSESCSRMVNKCALPPPAKCENQKCQS